ncbi:MAG: DUF4982 domain-containing protein [Bacteroidaceae bacterium]|nr:DUF4982 domain-containing protein [Bacteroidaceae bacterium]
MAIFLLSLLLLACSLGASAQTSFGKPELLNSGWRFMLSESITPSDTVPPNSSMPLPRFAQASTDDSRWAHVTIPHDWGVTRPMSPDCGSCQGYLPGGIGWYRNHIDLGNKPLAQGEHLFIYFEGAYNRSSVWLNGHLLGFRPSGFASFLYDLTPYLSPDGNNVLAVRIDHSRQNDSRWYTGSGIYRPVWLIRAPEIHLALWGSAWRIKSLNKNKASVEVDVETTNEGTAEAASRKAIVEILDATGKIVASTKTTIGAREKKTVKLNISTPKYWSLDNPYLYNVRTRLLNGSQETDRSEVTMGLRTLTFSPDKGFALNDKWMKVKGVCLHDDAGVLGTAVPSDVWRRRLQNLKLVGANAIRMSHNPHAPALYALCDSLGLLVMDEASDEWEFPKRKWLKGWNQGRPGFEGTFDYFNEWIDRDVADMVRRDRCHPSIFLWSIGNEVDYPNDPYTHPVLNGGGSDFTQPAYGGYKPEQPNAERIGIIAQRLAGIVRSIDNSRAVTGALAGVVMSNETAYPEAVDVVGYNYTESRYQTDHERYPKRVIYGSENRHDLPAWKAVRDNEHIFGQFLWTGIDYLGESGPWPARGSSAGLLDLSGNIKPNGHYRAALWSEKPVCYIGTYPNERRGRDNRNRLSTYAPALWNYREGQQIRVVCYTNAKTAQLFLNDKPVGGQPQRDEATDILFWDIDYAPGTLRCEAAFPGSQPSAATCQITTCGRPFALRATSDKATLTRQDEVAQITVEVIDENGIVVPLADNNISCYVSGQARLLGLENGDMSDITSKTDNRCRVQNGRIVAYVTRSDRNTQFAGRWQQPGGNAQSPKAVVHFSSPLLESTSVQLDISQIGN